MAMESLEQKVRERAERWTRAPYDTETQAAVRALLADGGEALIDAFYMDLEFGTGGLRGLMGPGTNRMNSYTVAMATEGLARFIRKAYVARDASVPSVAIAYDSRLQSDAFAQVVAEVMAGSGIRAYLFEALRPTPELSFAVRHLGCTAGVVVTASHNPKEYNGYKVYWSDGGQIVPPQDAGILAEVRGVSDYSEVRRSPGSPLIVSIGAEVDEAYRATVARLRLDPELVESGSDLAIVYTPLHGTGAVSVVPALAQAGFRNVHVVASQAQPDGRFPTVHSPNPEEGAALSAAIACAKEQGARLVMGTDPDADRVGLAVPDGTGEFRLLNGNETGALLVDYVLRASRSTGRMPARPFVAKTIVTSELIADIARHYGAEVVETLTGFKWIAEAIRLREGEQQFVVGGEESYGYMIGDQVRDKDAVASACLLAECAHVAARASDLLGELERIHRTHGAYREALVSFVKTGRSGKAEIDAQMETLRHQPPAVIAGERVVEVRDYLACQIRQLPDQVLHPTGLPPSNVVQLRTDRGSVITARPSGTEPKIKFYFSVRSTPEQVRSEGYAEVEALLEQRIAALRAEWGM
jgi:phosphoglucomutase